MDLDKLKDIIAEAKLAARNAASNYVRVWKVKTGGNKYGEPLYCGFAWVNLYEFNNAKLDGRSKVGRLLKQAGVTQDYNRSFQIWDPAEWPGQSMDVKEAGAMAASEVFQRHGFTAYAGTRAD